MMGTGFTTALVTTNNVLRSIFLLNGSWVVSAAVNRACTWKLQAWRQGTHLVRPGRRL